MAKKREANAYGKLIRIMIVLLVLVLLCGAGYVLMDQSIKAQEEEKQIRKQMAELTRNERTHRLCTRGGYLEKLLVEPELYTDEDVFAFLDYALSTPFVQTRLNSMLETKRKEVAKAEGTEAGESAN